MTRTRHLAIAVSLALITMLLPASLVEQLPTPESSPDFVARTQGVSFNASIEAYVTDQAGRPIAGATVSIEGSPETGLTNASGLVLFSNLMANNTTGTNYNLTAEKEGYRPSVKVPVLALPNITVEAPLVIFGGVIFGTVTEGYSAIVGALVSIPSLGFSNTTDRNGTYWLTGVPASALPYTVTVSAEGYVNQSKDVLVSLSLPSVLIFSLVSKTGSISGIVVHATTEEPLQDVNVSVRVGTVTVIVSTNESGTYTIPDLPSGTYTVTASLEGFEVLSVAGVVVVSGVDTVDVDFALVEKPARLSGTVKSGTVLLPGVTIVVEGTSHMTTSTVNGTWEIENVTAGTYTIVASLEGYYTATIQGVVVPRGGERQLSIDLEGFPGSVYGVVYSSESKLSLSGVEVTIYDNVMLRSTVTNVNGEFQFTGLAAGNYTIRFVLDEFKPKEIGPIPMSPEAAVVLDQVMMEPLGNTFGGFIFGFDLAHSMMILALLLTIVILAVAVVLRIRSFEQPERAPAVYDQEELGEEELAVSEDDEEEIELADEDTAEIRPRERKVKGRST